jgi:hypothetical protein
MSERNQAMNVYVTKDPNPDGLMSDEDFELFINNWPPETAAQFRAMPYPHDWNFVISSMAEWWVTLSPETNAMLARVFPATNPPRLFNLVRTEDISGVSGTGIVAEGAQFSTGKCVLSWVTKYRSVAVYDSLEELEAIHGHDGKTRVVWTRHDHE